MSKLRQLLSIIEIVLHLRCASKLSMMLLSSNDIHSVLFYSDLSQLISISFKSFSSISSFYASHVFLPLLLSQSIHFFHMSQDY